MSSLRGTSRRRRPRPPWPPRCASTARAYAV
uniref:Uncharacterized protein n=1 Tax=Human herpesvirus 2 TaxID=10310 RepID=A0A481TWX6_HHV2|nr:hypothetical protein [Human alphaherpesvirus 2]